jgi:hypothetical protein
VTQFQGRLFAGRLFAGRLFAGRLFRGSERSTGGLPGRWVERREAPARRRRRDEEALLFITALRP